MGLERETVQVVFGENGIRSGCRPSRVSWTLGVNRVVGSIPTGLLSVQSLPVGLEQYRFGGDVRVLIVATLRASGGSLGSVGVQHCFWH